MHLGATLSLALGCMALPLPRASYYTRPCATMPTQRHHGPFSRTIPTQSLCNLRQRPKVMRTQGKFTALVRPEEDTGGEFLRCLQSSKGEAACLRMRRPRQLFPIRTTLRAAAVALCCEGLSKN